MATGIAPSVLLEEEPDMLRSLFDEAESRDDREVKLHGG